MQLQMNVARKISNNIVRTWKWVYNRKESIDEQI